MTWSARMRVAYWLPFVVIALLQCGFARADDLDDALKCGVGAYADSQPPAGSWAQQLIAELKEDVPLNTQIQLGGVKFLLTSYQRQDGNSARDERMGTMSHAIQTCLARIPNRPVSAHDILDKAAAILTAMYPPAPELDPASLIEWAAEKEKRFEAAHERAKE